MPNMKKAFQLLGIYEGLHRVMTDEEMQALAGLQIDALNATIMSKLHEAQIAMEPEVIRRVLRDQGLVLSE